MLTTRRTRKEAAEYEGKWVEEKEAEALKECMAKGMKFAKPANNEKEWIGLQSVSC